MNTYLKAVFEKEFESFTASETPNNTPNIDSQNAEVSQNTETAVLDLSRISDKSKPKLEKIDEEFVFRGL